jgi:hypothetical protein
LTVVTGTREQAIGSPRKSRRGSVLIVDALVAVGLFVTALLYRQHFPRDGLFYDDAWQAFGAAEGSFGQLITIGAVQPGFGFELMVWSRIFGSGASTMVVPAMIAGALGPPALYLVLRKFGYAVSVSVLLGAALTVCETAILYSGHVKSYTADVLVILLLCVLLPWLARQQWRVRTAVLWTVGSIVLASFSPFTLLAIIAAAAILALHSHGDRKIRLIVAGVQAVILAGLFTAENRTLNRAAIVKFFKGHDAFIRPSLNPVTFGREIVTHFLHVTDVFPGGPAWFSAVCLVLAVVGLYLIARSGPLAVVGRFFVLMVGLTVVGSTATKFPFGPSSGAFRVTIWLTPIVAFGLAAVLQRVYGAAAVRSPGSRIAFNVVAFACSGLLLASAIGTHRGYPPGAALATRRVMSEAGPGDVVFITRGTMYTFALEAGTPVHVQRNSSLEVGFMPRFADKRLHPLDFLTTSTRTEITSALGETERAYVVDSLVDPTGYQKYRTNLDNLIGASGFTLEKRSTVGTANVSVWVRSNGSQPG